jgi:hypothetical protein
MLTRLAFGFSPQFMKSEPREVAQSQQQQSCALSEVFYISSDSEADVEMPVSEAKSSLGNVDESVLPSDVQAALSAAQDTANRVQIMLDIIPSVLSPMPASTAPLAQSTPLSAAAAAEDVASFTPRDSSDLSVAPQDSAESNRISVLLPQSPGPSPSATCSGAQLPPRVIAGDSQARESSCSSTCKVDCQDRGDAGFIVDKFDDVEAAEYQMEVAMPAVANAAVGHGPHLGGSEPSLGQSEIYPSHDLNEEQPDPRQCSGPSLGDDEDFDIDIDDVTNTGASSALDILAPSSLEINAPSSLGIKATSSSVIGAPSSEIGYSSSLDIVAPCSFALASPSSLNTVAPSSFDSVVPSSLDIVAPSSLDISAASSTDILAPSPAAYHTLSASFLSAATIAASATAAVAAATVTNMRDCPASRVAFFERFSSFLSSPEHEAFKLSQGHPRTQKTDAFRHTLTAFIRSLPAASAGCDQQPWHVHV